jgi:hypothetical protein
MRLWRRCLTSCFVHRESRLFGTVVTECGFRSKSAANLIYIVVCTLGSKEAEVVWALRQHKLPLPLAISTAWMSANWNSGKQNASVIRGYSFIYDTAGKSLFA